MKKIYYFGRNKSDRCLDSFKFVEKSINDHFKDINLLKAEKTASVMVYCDYY